MQILFETLKLSFKVTVLSLTKPFVLPSISSNRCLINYQISLFTNCTRKPPIFLSLPVCESMRKVITINTSFSCHYTYTQDHQAACTVPVLSETIKSFFLPLTVFAARSLYLLPVQYFQIKHQSTLLFLLYFLSIFKSLYHLHPVLSKTI
jgi:hypothetical protein